MSVYLQVLAWATVTTAVILYLLIAWFAVRDRKWK